jgi:hypothetical protein
MTARVSDVPEEAITSDTREPSYMFLAAEATSSSSTAHQARSDHQAAGQPVGHRRLARTAAALIREIMADDIDEIV